MFTVVTIGALNFFNKFKIWGSYWTTPFGTDFIGYSLISVTGILHVISLLF